MLKSYKKIIQKNYDNRQPSIKKDDCESDLNRNNTLIFLLPTPRLSKVC